MLILRSSTLHNTRTRTQLKLEMSPSRSSLTRCFTASPCSRSERKNCQHHCLHPRTTNDPTAFSLQNFLQKWATFTSLSRLTKPLIANLYTLVDETTLFQTQSKMLKYLWREFGDVEAEDSEDAPLHLTTFHWPLTFLVSRQ
ncbi:hypothetical protein ABKN59_006805 [Abortiporus biennis]